MSRILLTNNDNLIKSINDNYNQKGFINSFYSSNNNINVSVFKKLKVNNLKNYYKFSDNEYIVGIGTYIYKQKMGEDALKCILRDFDLNQLLELKQQINGVYTILIYRNNEHYIFNDYYGLSDLYYSSNYNFISSSLSDFLSKELFNGFNQNQLIHDVLLSNFSTDSILNGVKRLRGHQVLTINKNIRVLNYKIQSNNFNSKATKDAVKYISDYLKDTLSVINKYFNNISLCMTGGLDSRIILASFLANNISPTLVYGVSNSFLLPTLNQDKVIVEKIAKELSLDFKLSNWHHQDETFNVDNLKVNKELSAILGFKNSIYSGCYSFNEFISQKQSISYDFIEFGYFMEAIRLREFAEKWEKEFISLHEFIDLYYFEKHKYSQYSFYKSFRLYLYDLWVEECNLWGINDINHISINDFERLRWISARYSDSRICQYVNDYAYNFPLFSSPKIHGFLLNMPASIIKESQFQIELLYYLKPELMNFNVFSHRRNYVISNGKKILKFDMKNIVDTIFTNESMMKKTLVKLYRKIKYNSAATNKTPLLNDIVVLDNDQLFNKIFDYKTSNYDNHVLANLRSILLAYDFFNK